MHSWSYFLCSKSIRIRGKRSNICFSQNVDARGKSQQLNTGVKLKEQATCKTTAVGSWSQASGTGAEHLPRSPKHTSAIGIWAGLAAREQWVIQLHPGMENCSRNILLPQGQCPQQSPLCSVPCELWRAVTPEMGSSELGWVWLTHETTAEAAKKQPTDEGPAGENPHAKRAFRERVRNTFSTMRGSHRGQIYTLRWQRYKKNLKRTLKWICLKSSKTIKGNINKIRIRDCETGIGK